MVFYYGKKWMKYHIISDNQFFLLGLKKNIYAFEENVSYHNVYQLYESSFYPSPKDVVLIYITNVNDRYKIMSLPGVACCRVLLMLKVKSSKKWKSVASFPWVISDRTSAVELRQIIINAVLSEFRRSITLERERLIFDHLSEGESIQQISNITDSSENVIYYLKRCIEKRLDLRGNNASTILAVRDIMLLCKSYEHSFFKDSYIHL